MSVRALFYGAATAGLTAGLTLMLAPVDAGAVPSRDRFSAAGYLRMNARPDFQGGGSRLGLWNINGRLLNEGQYAALELKLDLLERVPGAADPWTSVRAKIEGDSVQAGDPSNGRLDRFRLTQLYVQAGNVLGEDVVFQMGTLHYYWGDLGLYDMRLSELFYDTMGLSAHYQKGMVDLLVGVGDAGYGLSPDQYSTILTGGGTLKLRPLDGLEFGVGGQYYFEPKSAGNRFAPHGTPLPKGISYADYSRREIARTFAEDSINPIDTFPNPQPLEADSYKLVGYVGFGGFGPLQWNSFYFNYMRRHPQGFYTERFEGRDYPIYVKELTDERTELNLGNQMQIEVLPGLFDVSWAFLYGYSKDADDSITASERNRTFWSTVIRGQTYLTPTVHFLTEYSYANERSRQGNLWRGQFDSVFQSRDGLADSEGFEFGDLDTRKTWQAKAGFVLNPTGRGIFTRPSLRLLYGYQKSNMHNAFGNSFSTSLDQFDQFTENTSRKTHSLVSLEAEAWF